MLLKKIIRTLTGRKENSALPGPLVLDTHSALTNLANILPDSLHYEWDDRFSGILAAFEVGERDPMLEILNTQFSHRWDKSTICDAPANIREAIKVFGNMKAGQFLFTRPLSKNLSLLGLWWPWGHGATISIRLVAVSSEPDDSLSGELNEVRTALRETFGV